MDQNEPVTFSLRLPPDLARRLDKLAEQQKRSRSNLIRAILEDSVRPPRKRMPSSVERRLVIAAEDLGLEL